MLAEGLYSLFVDSPAITALIGTPQTRSDHTSGIFPGQMPESSPLPAMVYAQIAGEGLYSLDGANAFHTSRLQFSCYGVAYSDAKKLARAVKEMLEGLKQTLPEGTEVDHCGLNLELDQFEYAPFVFRTDLDFEFAFREPTQGI